MGIKLLKAASQSAAPERSNSPHSRICGTTNNKMSWMTWNGVVAKPDTGRPSATRSAVF